MTKTQLSELLKVLEEKQAENLETAKTAALKYVHTNDGLSQRAALVDNATAETYGAVLNYIKTEILKEE